MAKLHQLPSLSKSALLLSPCQYWAREDVRWYDDAYVDTTNRDLGTAFHKEIDKWLRNQEPTP